MFDPAHEEDQAEFEPMGVRIGKVLAAATMAAMASALPAVLRGRQAGLEGVTALIAWAAFAALAQLPAIALVAGYRALLQTSRRAPRAVATILLGLALSGGLNVLVGTTLRRTTHHHALAGATYAVVSMIMLVVSLAVARRIASGVRNSAWVTGGATAALMILTLLAAMRVGRGLGGELPAAAAAHLIDGSALIFACVLAAQVSFRAPRMLSFAGPPLAMIVLLAGASTVLRGNLPHRIPEFAPDHARILAKLSPPRASDTNVRPAPPPDEREPLDSDAATPLEP
jgi:hypothetical protein